MRSSNADLCFCWNKIGTLTTLKKWTGNSINKRATINILIIIKWKTFRSSATGPCSLDQTSTLPISLCSLASLSLNSRHDLSTLSRLDISLVTVEIWVSIVWRNLNFRNQMASFYYVITKKVCFVTSWHVFHLFFVIIFKLGTLTYYIYSSMVKDPHYYWNSSFEFRM